MVTSTGKGLNVLIKSEYSFVSNWMSFGCWYSIQKNLPDSNVAILCKRQADNFVSDLFVWTSRVGVNLFKCVDFNEFFVELFDRESCNLFDLPLLILDNVVVVNELSDTVLNSFNEEGVFFADNFVTLLKDKSAKNDFLNENFKSFNFSVDVKSDSPSCLVSLGEDFVSSEWIHSNKVLNENVQNWDSLNESKVLDVWSQAAKMFPFV